MSAAVIDAGTAAVLVAVSTVWGRLDWREGGTSVRVVACLARIALALMAFHYALSALAIIAGGTEGGR